MGKIIFALSLLNLLYSANCLAQEIDPLERNQNGISYGDWAVRYDTTELYYVDLVFRVINYNGKPAETLYTRYVDFLDRQSSQRIKRIEIQQVLRKVGFKVIEGRDYTKTYFIRCAVNDRLLAFSGKDGGMVAVDIHTDQILYDHKNREDSVWPFWANDDFSMATMIEKKTSEEGFDKSSYVLFDRDFAIVARISYNLRIGKHGHIKNGIMSIPCGSELASQAKYESYININLNLLNTLHQVQENSYTIEDHGVSIGNGLIRIKDSGFFEVKLRPQLANSYSVRQSDWKILDDTIPDGKYYVNASNYFPINAAVVIQDNVLRTYQSSSQEDVKPLPKTEMVMLKLRAENIKGNFYFDKFTGRKLKGSISDGAYDIAWSDYLIVNRPLAIINDQISTAPPYFKSSENQSTISFKYQGFNYSHSGLTDTLGLEIIFYK